MAKCVLTILVQCLGLAVMPLEAGFRSPESLVRNVYAYYGQGSPGFSAGLPHDSDTARRFFDSRLQTSWASSKGLPYDFLVQGTSWKLGAVSTTVLRKQYDKTYVAVAFSNNGRAVTLNFIVVNGPDGWVITDVESPHDSLRMFLAQHRN
ncbi:hypothetical protein [Bradyrhizobium sp.]